MKKIISVGIFFTITIGLFGLSSFAGQIKPLKIGDKVPNIPFQFVDGKTGQESTGKLTDFSGKLVILDFWASWCNSCLRSFPKMNKIQSQNSGKVKMIMVNSRIFGGLTAGEFLAKRKKEGLWDFDLTLAVDDSIAFQLFPSYGIPHYVWISSVGRVIAITDEVTQEKVDEVLSGKDIDWPVKKDFFPNMIAVEQMEINKDLLSFSFFKKGKIIDDVARNQPMVEYLYSIIGNKKVGRGLMIKNLPLVELYKHALHAIQSRSRVILEVSNPSMLKYEYQFSLGRAEPEFTTKDENLFTYEIVVPADEEDKIPLYMLSDLNTRSGYIGKVEKRKVECLVLEPIDKEQKVTPSQKVKEEAEDLSGKNVFHYNNAVSFAFALNQYWILDKWVEIVNQPMINKYVEEKFGKCDLVLDISKPDQTLSEIENKLNKYGLHFVLRQIELDMLVISDR